MTKQLTDRAESLRARLGDSAVWRRPLPRELLIFLGFLLLTLLMTWPWVAHWRDAVSDRGDPYLNAWIMWWDYHQTFHDPLHLFQANIFYPYRYTLAFSEHNYGLALPFFPLFALGVRPLTVHSLALLLGFTLSGYGAFRLARTLTGSYGVAWVAGVAFAFVPYRFDHLPHVNYLSAGWIPLMVEALVLFARARSWRRAAWLGAAFLMNGLCCVHWFLLTLIPMALTVLLIVARDRLWFDRRFWLRAGVGVGAAGLLLLPFLLPYQRVAALYGFTRSRDEVMYFSADLSHWLVSTWRNRLWAGFGVHLVDSTGERALFPGLLLLLLPLAAVLLPDRTVEPYGTGHKPPPKILLRVLDALAILLAFGALYIKGADGFWFAPFGHTLVSASEPSRALLFLVAVLVVRCSLAYPHVFSARGGSLLATMRGGRRAEAFWLGALWIVLGFFGSFGLKFFFHRALYEMWPIFRSSRVPARWAMICYVGLALLAGLGARQCVTRLARWRWAATRPATIYALIVLALLFELRAAPLDLTRGAIEPDEVTQRLKATPLRGGVVALPCGETYARTYYVLRAADHARPLVDAYSGFAPPIELQLEMLTQARPLPQQLFDLLESIPASYLVVYNSYLTPESRPVYDAFLQQGVAAGRLRFIRSYGPGEAERQDLYAVTKNEPEARGETEAVFAAPLGSEDNAPAGQTAFNPIEDAHFFVRQQYHDLLGRAPELAELNAQAEPILRCGGEDACRYRQRAQVTLGLLRSDEFRQTGYLVLRLYQTVWGRLPTYKEFNADVAEIKSAGPQGKLALVERWANSDEFRRRYPASLSPAEFVDGLFRAAQVTPAPAERADLIGGVERGTTTRAQAALNVAERPPTDPQEFARVFLAMQYFGLLRRAPNAAEMQPWLRVLQQADEQTFLTVTNGFANSPEYRKRFGPA